MGRKGWTIAVVLALAALAAAVGYARFFRAVPMELATVARGSVLSHVAGPGAVQARVPVALSARVTSTIVQVGVDIGDTVRAGQVLVVLDGRDLAARRSAVAGQQESLARQIEAADAAVAKAQAELDLARARQRRDEELHGKGFVSIASLDTSQAAARAAEASLRSAAASRAARDADGKVLRQEAIVAGAQLGYTRLLAPMDGIVIERLAEPGTTVSPGLTILRLVDPATVWVTTRIDEALVERVRPGQPATIRLRSGTVAAGRVQRIAMQSDAATRELDVHVAFVGTPPRVALEQEADVRIETGREEGPVVPIGALLRDPQGRQGVLQVVDGRTRFVAVVTGPASDGRVLLREGLPAGATVVADASRARANLRVRPAGR